MLGMFGEAADLRDQSGGGNREMAGAQVEGLGAGDQGDGGEQGVEVGERFAHAHEDQVVHPFAGEALRGEHLAGDFGGVQIAGESRQPGGAELAAIGAAHLRGNTQRAAVGRFAVERRIGRHQHALHIAAVVQPKQQLAGAVGRALGVRVGEGMQPEIFRQGAAQRRGQVAHGGKRIDLFFPDPVEDLGSAEGGLAGLGQPGGEGLGRHA